MTRIFQSYDKNGDSKVTFEDMFARRPELIDRFSSVLAGRQAELDRIAADADASAAAIGARIRRFFGKT